VENIDIKLSQTDGGYDISLADNGDLTPDVGFDTAIYLSLFTDGRADISEISKPQLRGGWWGNTISDPPFELGSKLWILDNRRTENNRNKAITYAQQSLQWLIDGGYVKSIEVLAEYITEGLQLSITFLYENGKTTTKLFEAWKATEIT
jgi:phage gp46-like protein